MEGRAECMQSTRVHQNNALGWLAGARAGGFLQIMSKGRVFYWHKESEIVTLKVPTEGVYDTEKVPCDEFERGFVKAQRYDRGELNLLSPWVKVVNKGCVLYHPDSPRMIFDRESTANAVFCATL